MHHALTLLLSVIAFGAFALGMERHQTALCGRTLTTSSTWAWRATGWLGLAAALCAAVRGPGVALGLVSWFGHTSLAAGIVLLGLAAHQRLRASVRK